jgi:hypothetical protein
MRSAIAVISLAALGLLAWMAVERVAPAFERELVARAERALAAYGSGLTVEVAGRDVTVRGALLDPGATRGQLITALSSLPGVGAVDVRGVQEGPEAVAPAAQGSSGGSAAEAVEVRSDVRRALHPVRPDRADAAPPGVSATASPAPVAQPGVAPAVAPPGAAVSTPVAPPSVSPPAAAPPLEVAMLEPDEAVAPAAPVPPSSGLAPPPSGPSGSAPGPASPPSASASPAAPSSASASAVASPTLAGGAPLEPRACRDAVRALTRDPVNRIGFAAPSGPAAPAPSTPGSVELSPDGQQALRRFAAVLLRCPGAKGTVEGFHHNLGDPDRIRSLTHRRAEVVLAALARMGIESARFTVIGRGYLAPRYRNNADERHLNERVEIKLGGK